MAPVQVSYRHALNVLLVLTCLACSSGNQPQPEPEPRPEDTVKLPDSRLSEVTLVSQSSQIIEEVYQLQYDEVGISTGELIDDNADGTPDHAFHYSYENGRLARSDYDQFRDGNIDTVRYFHYDSEGVLESMIIDHLSPMRVDARVEYAVGDLGRFMVSREDTNSDGQTDVVTNYTYNTQGKLASITEDTGADEVVETRTTVHYNDEGFVITRDIDEGDDGSIEWQLHYRYETAICNAQSNHQPFSHSCGQ